MSKIGLKMIGMVFLVTCIMGVILSACNTYVFERVEAGLKVEVKACAIEAVEAIDGDKLERIINTKSNDCAEYDELLKAMFLFKAKKNVKNLYTFIKQDDKTALFVIDASPEPADFFQAYDMQQEMLEAFGGKVLTDDEPYTDEWGTFISGYAPIKNSAGQIIAIVGADSDVSVFGDIRSMFLYILVGAIAFSMLLALYMTFKFSQILKKDIDKIKLNLESMSKGNLTADINIKRKDEIMEIAQLLNSFRAQIGNTLSKIKVSVADVYSESEVLANISSEMSSSSQSVSALIQEVSRNSVNQTAEIIHINDAFTDFGREIQGVANLIELSSKKTYDISIKSRMRSKDIGYLIDSIRELNMRVEAVTKKVQGLGANINKVNEITSFINSIADQTNLLALNAAIEAARAGEAGRGFSIVADEIRKLAEQSKISSENINELIMEIYQESGTVVTDTEGVNRSMFEQIGVINGIAEIFEEIVNEMEELLPQMQAVHKSANEINSKKVVILNNLHTTSGAAQEISSSSDEIASLSEELSGSTEEVACTAGKLSDMMNDVAENINKFKTP